ncbi:hypothetical protein BCR35DRAFT_302261 [Leucosporidium creatinivorum]|uniref:FAD-binding PCMH-type domain-containing protein n=1 Tax=Leucosporidium creatinivorum TaxID=106004 RepID=A0A1Y2FTZ3_9BASI|nr:hypothetical protein BCR35DRAFT_302261 [Leucosporidium creatinivorum]
MSVVQQVLAPLFQPGSPYCLPSHPCFPPPSAFAALNSSLTGRLIVPEPTACVAGEGAPSLCEDAEWRVQQPGAVQFINFETGWQSDNTTVPVDEDHSRHRLPSYVVQATHVDDVQRAVAFAAAHRLRLRIKNTGHDYLGRSSAHGSFTLWTTGLNSTAFHPAFVPEGAPTGYDDGEPALVVGSGVRVKQLYEAADQAGVIVPGGVSASVGAAGGFVLGGGHGPLAPLLGLAADHVLEFTVVTSNATIVKASPFSNPSLFKALRGGGPAFGVVTEVALRAHTPPKGFVGIFGTFKIKYGVEKSVADEAWKGLIQEWVALQPKVSDAGPFAGYTYVRRPLAVPFAYVLPSDDLDLAKSTFQSFITHADNDPSVELNISFAEEKTWHAMWAGQFEAALFDLDEVGINLLLGGRLVPEDVVRHNTTDLADFLSQSKTPAIVHLVAGGAVKNDPYYPSSVNPRWRTALLHIDLPVSWPRDSPPASIHAMESYLTQHTLALGKIASAGGIPEGAYSSEANYHEKEWQGTWYGEENYQSLLEAKREWDPQGVFSGRKVVGSEFVGH